MEGFCRRIIFYLYRPEHPVANDGWKYQNLPIYTLITDTFSGCDWMRDTFDIFSCCSSSEPCGIYEGDCDDHENHTDCQGK